MIRKYLLISLILVLGLNFIVNAQMQVKDNIYINKSFNIDSKHQNIIDVKTSTKSIIKEFSYDNGIIGGGIGTGDGAHDFGAFIEIPTNDLKDYIGKSISALQFGVDNNSIIESAKIKIFVDDIENEPVLEQDINVNTISSGWNSIYLSNAYEIIAGKSIFIGVHVVTNEGGYTLSIDDDGAQYPDYSGFVYFNGEYGGTLAEFGIVGDFNVKAIIYDEVPQNDIELTKINVGSFIETGATEFNVTIRNKAAVPLTSFDMVYEIGKYLSPVFSVTDINIESGESYIVSHETTFNFSDVGLYTVSSTVDMPNGMIDEDDLNNTLTKEVNVVDELIKKKQLFEHFTSSTCPPCASYTPLADALLVENEGGYSLIRYQASWPGNGDPYTNGDVAKRVAYYDVGGVPSVYRNGEYNMDVSQAGFDELAELSTTIKLSVNATINVEEVSVSPKITSIVDLPAGLIAHIAIVENETVGNVGTNGETEFHNVLMKMLPSANGKTLVALEKNVDFEYTQTYDMSSTFVEEMDDLTAIVFIQDGLGNILQSESVDVKVLGEGSSSVTFNVSEGSEVVAGANINFNVVDYTTDDSGTVVIDNVADGTYNYIVSKDNYADLSGSVVVNGEDVVVNVNLTVGVNEITSLVNVYPNPTNDKLNIEAENVNEVLVYDISGVLVKSNAYNAVSIVELSLSKLERGVYFVSVKTSEGNFTNRVVKN